MSTSPLSPHFVLIDTQSAANVGRDVIPAAIEFVIHGVIPKRLNGDNSSAEVCLVSIDRPLHHFENLSSRGTISSANVLDCYANWYQEWEPDELLVENRHTKSPWYVASTINPEESSAALVQAVEAFFSRSKKSQTLAKVVVLDSLSSILSFSHDVDFLLQVLDGFTTFNMDDGHSILPYTIVATVQSSLLGRRVFESIRRLASTFVLIHGVPQQQNAESPMHRNDQDFVRIDVEKRKSSGRMHFEEHFFEMNWKSVQLCPVAGGPKAISFKGLEAEENNKNESSSLELAQHGLSFRVTLTSKEREVRAAAGLPYLHKNEELANSALEIHPENLRVHRNGVPDAEESSDNDSSLLGSDGEDMFSEDV